MQNTKLVVENLNNKAYEEIKRRIISKELEPGTRLVDSQLAEEYGISRTPVRDAIRKLANEGLVISNSNKGYIVFEATRQDVIEIFELRLMIDKEVVTKLITEMMPNDYEYYSQVIRTIENDLNEGIKDNSKDFRKYDEDFHDSIIRLSNNSRIIAIYAENRNQTKAFRSFTSYSEERVNKSNELHQKMLNGIKNMDLTMAIEAIKEHVVLSRKYALADFNET